MELKYIVLTIIKIVISVPAILMILPKTESAALMGGHLDNKSNSTVLNYTNYEYDFDLSDSQELSSNYTYIDEQEPSTKAAAASTTTIAPEIESKNSQKAVPESEEIPDPSPLVVPGYNLPDNIFNKGKPFYLEKDPLTGQIDFNSKTSSLEQETEYDYIEDEPSPDIFDKANINRKDGSLYSHKPSDVNQLTPNFHDFLNLPVKYNPEKYVYPLISSSYANTKIQGNVNKYHNHKDYVTTYKPTVSPTYYTSPNGYFNQNYKTSQQTMRPSSTTTTTQRSTTVYLTTTTKRPVNLMNSPMNQGGYDMTYKTTQKPKLEDIYLTTENVNNIYLTTKTQKPLSTTKRPMSIFEQLFGSDYEDDMEATEKPVKPPPLFSNLPSNKNKNKYDGYNEETYSTTGPNTAINGHQNVLTGSHMEHVSAYEYEDYGNEFVTDNIAVESKPNKHEEEFKPSKVETPKPFIDTTIPKITLKTTTLKTTLGTTTTQKPSSTSKFVVTPVTTQSTKFVFPESTTKSSTQAIVTKPTEKFTFKPYGETTTTFSTTKVTSLPLGENHVAHNNRQPIIVATHNLKEQLNNEKVGKPFVFDKPIVQHAPSTSNIHIAPDQDTVSFVVGHHQSVEGGQYVGSDFKVSPYDHNPFRPLYAQPDRIVKNEINYGLQNAATNGVKPTASIFPANPTNEVSYTIQTGPEVFKQPNANHGELGGSAVNIQPIRNSEASLTIGVPVNNMNVVPGKVMDEKLEVNNEKNEFPKGTGNKVVFPDETKEPPSTISNLLPPPKPSNVLTNREVLNLSSKPMFHQLPSELTPPNEKEMIPPPPPPHLPPRHDRPRPPWDPRPGHFYAGRPEYARPPRPHIGPTNNDIYKRIDNLPNILPQFRPNMKANAPHHYYEHMNKVHMRQPLLDRPSNKPIGFFEKLQPPPPPKHLMNIRKGPIELRQNLPPYDYDPKMRQPGHTVDRPSFSQGGQHNVPQNFQNNVDRIGNEGHKKQIPEQYPFYQTPPKVIIANRRNGEDDPEVETLQMIQAKQTEKNNSENKESTSSFNTNLNGKDSIEKPLYVVYPVNTPPLKLDAIDNSNKETVVIGTRAELPLPPSKIQDSIYDQNPLLNPKRNDAPILKPHPRPANYPVKSDFPYHIERPDQSLTGSESYKGNKLDNHDGAIINDNTFLSSNQWNTLDEDPEARIVTGVKINAYNPNQISATLKTYTEKPIAVAYTPTEAPHKEFTDKYSMPNYGSPVIPEIRPGIVDSAEISHGGSDSEFTVSAVMHTHPQLHLMNKNDNYNHRQTEANEIHRKSDEFTTHVPQIASQDFQAPFQASVNLDIDNINTGWKVVRDKAKSSEETDAEITTIPVATTSEFDIENFKPQLEGGFKPLYSIPEPETPKESDVSERQE